MKRLRNHLIGIAQGDTIVFSDFDSGGEMWTGRGQRERRKQMTFEEPFRSAPSLQVSISMWDVDSAAAIRADVTAENITRDGFELVFRTWGDTKIARARLSWIAIGELREADDWDLY